MKAAVVVFPGSNCDRELTVAFQMAGFSVDNVWHKDAELPHDIDIVGLPGGFSFGDYLRCGALAAQSMICGALKAHAERGGYVLGICNGFQMLTEMGLLPGVLLRNAGLKYLCKTVNLRVPTTNSIFSCAYDENEVIQFPIAHHDGNFFADDQTLSALDAEDRVAFRYVENINGSRQNIAGILSSNRRVLGMMPHPERAVEDIHQSVDGSKLFSSVAGAFVST
ncbi:MAG: phosphoribosylformylglycinamidine synthase subunit PurQ [Aestuariivita sp.]|nr:phosphoribosylformylglycinamidine synthase subunit PurQ [Aestuariivita sp.]MCY4201101.1 phosphoribosylformylglycinamidine synthase subunit PurQ [Aestuariivita sp.]MCY4288288.1 phosphoribosylformylglycinamidine synthase subunit PurQ [Aestuariivita sp.]MCY4345932.1 phosphoribosylformylglycinamidine synthase subunit PurQ [Aestuariivita sp.]